MRVGIPGALLYYQYFPAWKKFFEELGAEVIVSPPTTRDMLAAGSARVVADTCLPVKVFLGHVLSLVNECDYIFIPAVRSVREKVYNCSKFLGLPDMTRAVIPELPPMLEIEIDINQGKPALYNAVYGLGRHLTRNPVKIRRAGMAARQALADYREMMSSLKITHVKAIDKVCGRDETGNENITGNERIAFIGHPYLLYDEYINHRLISRLEKDGIGVVTPEMVAPAGLESAVKRLVGGAYWTYEDEVVGAGGHYLESGVDGVIGIMAFGCGPDSLMMDAVRRRAAAPGSVPFMCLTVDEHTAEAGIVTRLEAFTDMMRRRNRVKTCA
jgi:predicted nucleotide-binding protein (sugar kinase/HSP70/actin superfamily)